MVPEERHLRKEGEGSLMLIVTVPWDSIKYLVARDSELQQLD